MCSLLEKVLVKNQIFTMWGIIFISLQYISIAIGSNIGELSSYCYR